MKKYNHHKNKIDKKHIEVLNDIYDILTDNAYSYQAQCKLKKFISNKAVEVSYTENTIPYIKLGNNFYLLLTNKINTKEL